MKFMFVSYTMLCIESIQKSGLIVLIAVLVGWAIMYFVMFSRGLNDESNAPQRVVEVPYYSQIMNFLNTGGRNR